MNTQPESFKEALTELRRLHEVNQALVEALKQLIGTGLHQFEYNRIMSDRSHYVNAALAKARGTE